MREARGAERAPYLPHTPISPRGRIEWHNAMPRSIAPIFAILLACLCRAHGHADSQPPSGALQLVSVESGGELENAAGSSDAGASSGVPNFEPTTEWKEILPNQAIPGGLEVRIDLSTGKKHARTLQTEAPPPDPPSPAVDELLARALPASVRVKRHGGRGARLTGRLSRLWRRTALARCRRNSWRCARGSTAHAPRFRLLGTPHQELRRKVWLKRQVELRKAIEARDEHTDVIARLLYVFMRPEGADEEEKVAALRELESLVDKLDFARDLHKLGGLLITVAQLNESLPLASAAAWVIGAAGWRGRGVRDCGCMMTSTPTPLPPRPPTPQGPQ